MLSSRFRRAQQHGFIASYILYGIGLLAIVGAAYGRLNITGQQDRLTQNAVDEISAQVEVLTGKVLLCAAVYPDGDHGQFNTRHAYPAPNTPGHIATADAVECPGAPPGARLLSAMPDGVPVPVSPPDFNPWNYEHSETLGIRLRLDPKVSGGAAVIKNRLIRQFPGSASLDGDDLVFTILN